MYSFNYNKILVTGGAGFIGSVFIDMMMKKYPHLQIVMVDCLTYASSLDNLGNNLNEPRFKFVCATITDFWSMREVMLQEKPDAVINFAAESHVDNSIKHPRLFTETNVIGTLNLLHVCAELGIKRFHQVSTDEVYGFLPLDKPELKFTETMPLNPSSPYSASKAAADMYVLAYGKTFGLDITISRCSNNYGRNQHDEKMIPTIIRHALKDEKIPVYGDGSNVRDWIYVEDHCSAIDYIMDICPTGQIYNVGGHTELSNNELVRIILNKLNKPETLIEYVTDRPGHDLRYAINDKKLYSFGWKRSVDFYEGIDRTISYYVDKYSKK